MDNEGLTLKELADFVSSETGYIYSWLKVSNRLLEEGEEQEEPPENDCFYQLMPDGLDDGFFDWYIQERPFNQFFRTPATAAIRLIQYFRKWKKLTSEQN